MTVFQGIVLGVLQGVAEFLPISSSGHLAVAQKLFGLEEVPLLFDVFLHLATLLSVVLFFRKKIWVLLSAFGRLITKRPAPVIESLTQEQSEAYEKNLRMYILSIIAATFVTAAIGIVTSKVVGDFPSRYVCAGFIVTAVLLITSALLEKLREKKNAPDDTKKLLFGNAPTLKQSLLIGFAQGFGTLPGISRSGSTIAGSMLCGVDRAEAGEFSFIVSIPAILGAFILEVKDIGEVSSTIGAATIICGCAAAFASGYLALTWLMKLIKKGKLEWFACYLIPAGLLGLIFLR